MNYKQLLIGFTTYIPGVYHYFSRTGGTDSARYCYTVWLRHLVKAYEQGLILKPPSVVGELGPGDSLGTGLAALISGVDTYYAFDLVRYANSSRNLEIFDELVELFRNREDIPGEDEFPKVKPCLASYQFPSKILDEEYLQKVLAPQRIEVIRKSLADMYSNDGKSGCISYVVPWNDPSALAQSSVDMVYSQAVLEHVDDLELIYQSLYRWLKPRGFTSHAIDFTSHGTSDKWNGHWSYSNFTWRLMRGNRAYFLNRQPYSVHKNLLNKFGFEVMHEVTIKDPGGIQRCKLASEFLYISDHDLLTRSAFVQAVKTR